MRAFLSTITRPQHDVAADAERRQSRRRRFLVEIGAEDHRVVDVGARADVGAQADDGLIDPHPAQIAAFGENRVPDLAVEQP